MKWELNRIGIWVYVFHSKLDVHLLKSMGVGELFAPGTDTREIIDYLSRALHEI